MSTEYKLNLSLTSLIHDKVQMSSTQHVVTSHFTHVRVSKSIFGLNICVPIYMCCFHYVKLQMSTGEIYNNSFA